MKSVSALLTVGFTAVLLFPGVALAERPAPNADKVKVCHTTGNGAYRLVSIGKNAVPAHVEHGDALPESVVSETFVGPDCTVVPVTRVSSGELSFGAMGWGGMSCPTGTVVVGGGYEPAELNTLVTTAAKPGESMYPNYPHYTFGQDETGWVVQNINEPQTLTVYALCIPK